MNSRLASLQPYPFERLRALFDGVVPPAHLSAIRLSIGEPQHPTPPFLRQVMDDAFDGLASYPTTAGSSELRECIAEWLARRYGIPAPDPLTQVLPVNGSREALFAIAQTVIDGTRAGALVVSPNPFYQIYEGAALLAGATPVFLNTTAANGFRMNFSELDDAAWRQVQLVYVCSPGNPTGHVMDADEWRELYELSDAHGFVIASDECYSEIFLDEAHPPMGALQVARMLGRDDYRNLLVFSSLSKRSNVPGLRSGFVAGDAALIRAFLLYRTYHGGAMSPTVQRVSIAAWNDEEHVRKNREQYRAKFATVTPLIASRLETSQPDASFYLWARTPGDDAEYARSLFLQTNVTVLPGSYLAREHRGVNPGAGYVRIALVAPLSDCVEAANRIHSFNQ